MAALVNGPDQVGNGMCAPHHRADSDSRATVADRVVRSPRKPPVRRPSGARRLRLSRAWVPGSPAPRRPAWC